MCDEDDLFSGRISTEFINLTVGAPGPDTLKKSAEIFASASQHRLQKTSQGDVSLFQYGPQCGPSEYLQQLAKFLTCEYSDQVLADNLVLTCGATNGLHLASTTLLQKAEKVVVFVECPTYFIATDVLKKDLGFCLVPVVMEGDGVNIQSLEFLVEREYRLRFSSTEAKRTDRFWSMFYTIPTFHNPTGILTSPTKCQKIVEIARKYDMLIFCDDVYNLLYYNGDSSPKRLFAFDNPSDSDYDGGRVVSNGTFSKILSPGVRVGWIEAGPRVRNQLKGSGVLCSGGSVNNVMAGFISSALELGLEKDHIIRLRSLYRQRIASFKSVLDEKLPEKFECNVSRGGYFIWLSGPSCFDAKAFSLFCKERFAVQVLPGNTCCPCDQSITSDTCSNSFRLSIAYYEEQYLILAGQRLCEALASFSMA